MNTPVNSLSDALHRSMRFSFKFTMVNLKLKWLSRSSERGSIVKEKDLDVLWSRLKEGMRMGDFTDAFMAILSLGIWELLRDLPDDMTVGELREYAGVVWLKQRFKIEE